MATPQDICTLSLSEILNDDATQIPVAADLNFAFTKLQDLLDYLRLDPKSVVGLKQAIYTPAVGDQVMTIGNSLSVTSATSVSTVATITTTTDHGLAVGDYVNISGATPTAYNGKYIVTAVSSQTVFTYSFAGGTSPATGTILCSPDVVMDMPQRLEEASFCRLGNVDFLIGFASSFEEYNAQPVKTNQGYPTKCFYNRNEINRWGTLYMWPASNGAELHIWTREDILDNWDTMTLSSTLVLPMGMKKMLVDILSGEMLDSYNLPEPAYSRIKQKAANSLRKWKRSNIQINMLQMPTSIGRYTANNYTA